MYDSPDRIASLASRIMHASVLANAAGRYRVRIELRCDGRLLEAVGQRLQGGAATQDKPSISTVHLDQKYAELLLEQMLTTVESMR